MYKLADIMKEGVGEEVWCHSSLLAKEVAMVVSSVSYDVVCIVLFSLPHTAVEIKILWAFLKVYGRLHQEPALVSLVGFAGDVVLIVAVHFVLLFSDNNHEESASLLPHLMNWSRDVHDYCVPCCCYFSRALELLAASVWMVELLPVAGV